ncbi:MAG: glycoside hydrolase family 78 protein [Mangrovibacterium sp.]
MMLGFSIQYFSEASVRPVDLRCEMQSDPVGIDVSRPCLSWQIAGTERGIEQSAYQILVASNPANLDLNTGDLWDSGKVVSGQSSLVAYDGKILKSRDECYWKVRIWTGNSESEWSIPAKFSMGLLYYKDWTGRWIGFDHPFPWDREEKFSRLSARYFRKEFAIQKEVRSAKVYIIGLGLYELYLNGRRIGDQVLAPAPTDYSKNVKYNVFDVTEELISGNNAIGVVLGNGRYYTMRQAEKPYKIKTFGYPKLLLQLELSYTDGTSETVKTDNSWKGTADGPIRTNNEYDGEEYDARKEMPGWSSAGFDDNAWLHAEYVQEPQGEFEAQMNPPVKVMKTIQPVSVTEIRPGVFILDMGQNMAGWLWMRVRGKSGDQVTLRFAEILNERGELATANLRDAKATDVYTLKGGGDETWEPSFVYHGFRYAEISGYPGRPSAQDFEGRVVYDDLETAGYFKTSNELINRIYENAWWGISGNYKGMPVDCPQRNERQPWLGERATGAYGESFIFGNALLYAKWLTDIRNAQRADGSTPDVAPAFWRYYSDNMTWAGTYLMVADMLLRQFGDIRIIEQHYPHMKRWLKYMQERYMNDEFIMTKDSYGDWCPPPATIEEGRGKNANRKYPSMLISTAYHYYYLQLMQKFARLTGHEEDISAYASLAEKVRSAFNRKFFNVRNNYYGQNSLTDNLLPYAFGLVPPEYRKQIFQTITDLIEIKNNGHLSTGMIGTQWLMRTLTENGRADLAYRIATNKTYPGWGYMVGNGATTIWELWNGNTAAPNMNSHNHVMMLGDLIIWFYENLAGIKSDETFTGFKKVIMKPEPVKGLDFVDASYQSPYGLIKSAWKRKDGLFIWNIVIPANSRAEIYIPAGSLKDIRESDKALSGPDQIQFLRMEGDRAVFGIGSGEYHFVSKL